ncbi:hypothetical protein LTR91_020345 [Friedmanniomyces endolithicus]|uniref:Apple domain-containing protein n=1 Tax=Friedmanniomyces endolithicus TaxID=329885 RepID=A0AAN6HCK9_9PEZI|nr:hypothetical protein LTR94_014671 [Friedmanniomyces endolithicus]KAK0783964.1 hypothetical protein LTR38_012825 [Friedmanniomyces endolithicus]KAK0789277.1 hypothetical protein LTR59_009706 [Friedmanniomyces endolithicus]KAK0815603.1 hypothetical protein LTR75_003891 [Friedmanniomyces endolithicus]KAK0835303.1 hypothetical protein LTR03_014030 [Friedmanniomyces endolithicus]
MDLPSIFDFFVRLTQPSTSKSIWHQPSLDTMIVPDLKGLQNATAELNETAAGDATTPVVNATEIVRKAKTFGKANARLSVSNGTGQTQQAKKEPVASSLQDRQTCASGSAFYACANGFRGCCSVDPCNPGSTCPDGQDSSTTATSTTNAPAETAISTTLASSTEQPSTASSDTPVTLASVSAASSTQNAIATQGSTTLVTASPTGGASAFATVTTPASSTVATPAPACPATNNTMYTDSSEVQYNIRCNADNSYASSDTIQVSVGGYGECFSACSNSTACAGFTYVGLDTGSCYLKEQMPATNYAPKNGSNYISCAKVNPTAVAPSVKPSSTGTPSGAKKSNTGAVAGGVIGGIALLLLLLLLIALLTKRHRKRIEDRRANATHIFHGPTETQDMTRRSAAGGHARTGSTAHDAFAPFGGFYRGFSSAQADRQAEDEDEKMREANALVPDRLPPSLPPGLRAEKSGGMMPAGVYRRPGNHFEEIVAMLDGTPINRPQAPTPGSRSPRFHENIAEMEDTSNRTPPSPTKALRSPRTPDTDSPTLGRNSENSNRGNGPSLAEEVRRRQHLMSWNTYDPRQAEQAGGEEVSSATMVPRTPPAVRSPDQVSPDLSNMPRDSSFVVSPFGSLERGHGAPR